MFFTSCVECHTAFSEPHGWRGRYCAQCEDPTQREFPLRADVACLRKRWLALRAALTAVEQAGTWLRTFESRWPENADKGLEDWAAMKSKLEAVIRKVTD